MSESTPALTPMMRQYHELKNRDPEALLLFRMGDFYEMFGDDADRAHQLLGLAVATRDKDKGPNASKMAGFPHPALNTYLAKLVEAGVRVAVCEQVEDPKLAKGVVKREIVRVVTAGTLTEDAFLDPKTTNYLAAIVEVRGKLGLAWVELSTGHFSLTGVSRTELVDEIARLNPAEVLVSEVCMETPWARALRVGQTLAVTARPSWDFVPEQARKVLHEQFRTQTLGGFGVDDESPEVQAAGALVAYLRDTQKHAIAHINRLTPYHRAEVMALDEMTRRSLELTRTLRDSRREGSLLHAIDQTCTPMGARLLAGWLASPLTGVDPIRARHDAVAELVRDASLRVDLRTAFDGASDLERLAARVGTGRATPRDLVHLSRTLALLPRIKARLTARTASELLTRLEAGIELCPEIRAGIEAALVEDPPLTTTQGGLIRDGYHADLDAQRELAHGGKSWINKYQAEQIRRTGIGGLKIGFNNVFGYYIEVSHAQSNNGAKIPADFIRKQTVKNAERYITPELKEYEDKVRHAEERAHALEAELFATLRDRVAAEAPRLVQVGVVLAQLDVLAGLAELAAKGGYCRPEVVAEPVFEVEGGRHPVLDHILPAGAFVPNDIALGPDGGTILLITGPNMAGKSTYIRQVALSAVLAQMGSFVPARRARIGVVDRLFARVGATDELGRGQSTFMVEMTETANILNNATPRSLIILDEIGRGTSTFDGVSLAWAIAEHIHDHLGSRTLFATHYHELVDLAQTKPNLRNANVAVQEHDGEIIFLHRIVPGGADQSYGIHVARLAGVPGPVLTRSREILAFLEKQHLPAAAGAVSGPLPKVKTGRALQNSLFAALPDPILQELREVDIVGLSPEAAVDLVRRLQFLAR